MVNVFGQPKISQFEDTLRVNNVGRLQVPMDNMKFYKFVDAISNLSEDLESLVFLEKPCPLINDVLEIGLAKLHDHVDVASVPDHFVELDDVFVV